MAAGGFCVSDCSSPHRPSCCHYRLVFTASQLRAHTTQSALNTETSLGIFRGKTQHINRLGLFRVAPKPAPGSEAARSATTPAGFVRQVQATET